tara:strand:+ start:1411 stop:1581 length:171 start_codon:yes stop_codon:yes gene_type:complete
MKHYEMRKYPHERMEQFDARISMKGNKRVKRNLKEWFKHKYICALKHRGLLSRKER